MVSDIAFLMFIRDEDVSSDEELAKTTVKIANEMKSNKYHRLPNTRSNFNIYDEGENIFHISCKIYVYQRDDTIIEEKNSRPYTVDELKEIRSKLELDLLDHETIIDKMYFHELCGTPNTYKSMNPEVYDVNDVIRTECI